MMGQPRRSLWQAIRAFFRYLDEHSPAEVFGGLARRARRALKSWFSAGVRRLSDPLVASVILGAATVAAGFAVMGLAWRGAAATLLVPVQLPYLVSGGIGGLALVLVGVGALHIQGSRWLAARERDQMERVRGKALLVLEATTSMNGRRDES